MALEMLHTKLQAHSWGVKIDPSGMLPDDFHLGDDPSVSDALNAINSFKILGEAIVALCAITCIIFLIINITKLGAAADNEMARRKAITGILLSGAGVAVFGGLTTVIAILWNFAANI